MRPSSEIAEGAFAHSLPDRPVSEWQPLRDHLEGVAELSVRFASAFGAADWGRWAGLGHDLGKFSDAFQGYLRSQSDPDAHAAEMSGRTDHATAGAQYAVESLDVPGHLLAYALAGHHSGLLDGRSERWGSQEKRLAKDVSPWEHGLRLLSRPHAPVLPEFVRESLADRPDPFVAAFFTRFLYSALVDADFLDTERFMDPERAAERPDWPEDVLEDMARRLDAHVDSLGARC